MQNRPVRHFHEPQVAAQAGVPPLAMLGLAQLILLAAIAFGIS